MGADKPRSPGPTEGSQQQLHEPRQFHDNGRRCFTGEGVPGHEHDDQQTTEQQTTENKAGTHGELREVENAAVQAATAARNSRASMLTQDAQRGVKCASNYREHAAFETGGPNVSVATEPSPGALSRQSVQP